MRIIDYSAIEFDIRDWANGFFISFRIPYSPDNYLNVIEIPGSANIKLIR